MEISVWLVNFEIHVNEDGCVENDDELFSSEMYSVMEGHNP